MWDKEASERDTQTWFRSNKEWRNTLKPASTLRARSNASWGLTWDTSKWEDLWKHLWKARLFPRDKPVKQIWQTLTNLHCRASGEDELRSTALISVVENLLKPANSALLVVFVACLRFTWRDRCKAVFEGKRRATPAQVILLEAERTIAGLKRKYISKDAQERIEKTTGNITMMAALNSRSVIDRTYLGSYNEDSAA
ncbi:hypothetical protein R1sor_001846 [Riccia sorocarpa]|uniref:Uncharacterized protein n=1 Tax=Riccia sorocarpa TaxID=122646 RepID=A0ABD3H309_9MARC